MASLAKYSKRYGFCLFKIANIKDNTLLTLTFGKSVKKKGRICKN